MHLPTPQFSRLVTVLAFDLTHPMLDSMILAWDHITTRYLNRISTDRELAGKLESIRLLAIHDAVHTIFGSQSGYIFNGTSSGTTLDAALAATAQASHDILAAVFTSPEDRSDLKDSLEESLSLISDQKECISGAVTGAASAAAYTATFAPLVSQNVQRIPSDKLTRDPQQQRFTAAGRPSLRLAKDPAWRFDWRQSA